MFKDVLKKIDLFFCNILDWHQKPKEEFVESDKVVGFCQICHRKMIKNNEGKWF